MWEAYPIGRPGPVASARRPRRPRFLAVRVCSGSALGDKAPMHTRAPSPRAALGCGNAITQRWVSGALRVFPEHRPKLCYVRCGTKSKGKLERRGGRTPLHLHLPTSVAAQPQRNTHRREVMKQDKPRFRQYSTRQRQPKNESIRAAERTL